MPLIAYWIVGALTTAWALISGVAGVAAGAALASAVALLPAKSGVAASSWLAVANFYMPVNEAITFFFLYLLIAAYIKIARWSLLLKK